MPKKLWSKVVILPTDMGAIPSDFDSSIRTESNHLNFLCMASDYDRKGVGIVLKAWSEIENKYDSTLTIVCPKFPELLKKNEFKNVKWVEEGPLSLKSKKDLYSSHHVALCPTLIDNCVQSIEAMEYGMPIVISEFHRSSSFMVNDVGYIVKSPYQYYDINHYGIMWKSIDEYLSIVNTAISNGEYQSVIEEWKKYILRYIDDQSLSYIQGENSYNIASTKLSQSFRNSLLIDLYKKTLKKV